FGFGIKGAVDLEHPARELEAMLYDSSTVPKPYGALERPYRFVRNQLAMQLRKRTRKKNFNP
ncbi:MAG: hypothetical protein ACE5OQ_13540, partial [Woeseia sp.]